MARAAGPSSLPARRAAVPPVSWWFKWSLLGLAIAGALYLLRPDLFGRSVASEPPAAALPAPSHPAIPPPEAPRRSFADAVARAGPAVVNIYTARVVARQVRPSRATLFGRDLPMVRRRVEGSLGSGVIVDRAGNIVTNYHVISNTTEIRVQLDDGRVATPRIVGVDPETDLAVLHIDLPDLPVMPLGRSNELRPGDLVLAIGNPLGLSHTVTQGIVSATGRGRLGVTTFEDFIQTDAAINFGNSGGALINIEGELVGINTAVPAQALGTEGIGFAIPVNMVRGVLEQILEHGRVRRGWLGVTDSDTLPRERAAALGLDPPAALVVLDVEPDGPAARAGLRRFDVITHINGQPVVNDLEALNRVAAMPPGATVQIRGRRGNQPLELEATLAERALGAGA